MTFNLDTPLIDLSDESRPNTYWTARNAVEGVQIFGGIGSGKTSGSGRMLALKYLKAGFGGLVLTVKPDEKKLWQDYCALAGRSDDLIIVEPLGEHRFNFFDYEVSKTKEGISPTDNLVQVLKTVINAEREKATGKADDPFWENALDMLIYNTIDLCYLAHGQVSAEVMYNIVQSIPKSGQPENQEQTDYSVALNEAKRKAHKKIVEWRNSQPSERLTWLDANLAALDLKYTEEIPIVRELKFIIQFFTETFQGLAEKTRSTIELSFTAFLFRLLRDPVYSLFCFDESTFSPDDCADGKIILLNLPVKEYHKTGRDVQIMFKYIWQRAMEKRDLSKSDRPVFLWADEAQNFLHEHDPDYQATARSSRIATVYISQNLPNYHANMGGNKSDYKVNSFLGTLATKIFHANADIDTNKYASELIGDREQIDTSQSATIAGEFSSTKTSSINVKRAIRPEVFSLLKTGGDANNRIVQGYVHLQGNLLNKENHIRINFNQDFKP